jgi:hypothetical protein
MVSKYFLDHSLQRTTEPALTGFRRIFGLAMGFNPWWTEIAFKGFGFIHGKEICHFEIRKELLRWLM